MKIQKKEDNLNPEINFIKQKFCEYYQRKKVAPPMGMERREFGFGNDRKIDYRHMAFKTASELEKYFITQTPLYASCSAAYYEFPEGRPMPKKGFIGADLVFEFDAECKHNAIACEECLEEVKKETVRLIEEFLIPDFGFKKEEIRTVFSGARGYHIYVYDEATKQLDGSARRQIIDYIQGRGISDCDINKNVIFKEKLRGGKPDSGGWVGKYVRTFRKLVENSEVKQLRKKGLVKSAAAGTPEQKEEILKQIDNGTYFRTYLVENKGILKIPEMAGILKKEMIDTKAEVDQLLTLDIYRLVRMPSTLHGGTGMVCTDAKNMDAFHPFKDAVVFGDTAVKVKLAKDVPAFVLKDQTFGPFKAEEIKELPEFAAVFLVCKELAKVVA